jgi:hypothetical protein
MDTLFELTFEDEQTNCYSAWRRQFLNPSYCLFRIRDYYEKYGSDDTTSLGYLWIDSTESLRFLENVEKLLNNWDFSWAYKFAQWYGMWREILQPQFSLPQFIRKSVELIQQMRYSNIWEKNPLFRDKPILIDMETPVNIAIRRLLEEMNDK